jgi:hypothetical protein
VATRRLAFAIVGTLLCLPVTTAAAARDCRDETPLPPDVRLIAPAADVPAAFARFAGVWVGPWKETGGDTVCATLVVEEVLPSGHARLVYSHGAWEPLPIRVPAYFRAAGRIVDDELRFALPTYDRAPMAYRFTAGALAGTIRGAGHHAATRAPDLAGIGCRRRLTATIAPPTPGAPRDRLTASQLLAGPAPAARSITTTSCRWDRRGPPGTRCGARSRSPRPPARSPARDVWGFPSRRPDSPWRSSRTATISFP